MKVVLFLVALLAVASALPVTTKTRSNKCEMKPKYPPSSNYSVPTVAINLDLPPQERWVEVATAQKDNIKAMIDTVFDMLPESIVKPLLARLDGRADEILNGFPAPYGDEIRGIAKATGMDTGLLIIYNIFYEVFGLCTSIVAEGADGQQYHGRNLDFGLFLGWNFTGETWALPDRLRPLLFNANFQRGGKTVYTGVYYAGYVGMLTGVKAGAFSISVDSRFDDKFDRGLIQWLHGDHEPQWLTFTTRSIMDVNSTFDDAVATLQSVKMVGPSYVIVGGAKPGDGAVVTRAEDKALDVWTIKSRAAENKFYVLETNYDHWKKAPFFDDRRDPANACMDQLGKNGTDFAGLYNVLSAHPNLNQLTTYTALMNIQTGAVETYLQFCPHPCPIW